MEVNFKYEIGEPVYLRQELKRWHEVFGALAASRKTRDYDSMGDLSAKERRPSGLQVIERHMQQCYGGIQLHYHVRAGVSIAPFTEPELTNDFNDPAVTS